MGKFNDQKTLVEIVAEKLSPTCQYLKNHKIDFLRLQGNRSIVERVLKKISWMSISL